VALQRAVVDRHRHDWPAEYGTRVTRADTEDEVASERSIPTREVSGKAEYDPGPVVPRITCFVAWSGALRALSLDRFPSCLEHLLDSLLRMQVAPSSDDYNYEGFNAEWSQDDLEIIDAVISDAYTTLNPVFDHETGKETRSAAETESRDANGGPQLQIEYEITKADTILPAFKAVDSMDTLLHVASQEPSPSSPYTLFRSRRNILSVTDLVGPQWFEFAHYTIWLINLM
jgi:hypothetical protein